MNATANGRSVGFRLDDLNGRFWPEAIAFPDAPPRTKGAPLLAPVDSRRAGGQYLPHKRLKCDRRQFAVGVRSFGIRANIWAWPAKAVDFCGHYPIRSIAQSESAARGGRQLDSLCSIGWPSVSYRGDRDNPFARILFDAHDNGARTLFLSLHLTPFRFAFPQIAVPNDEPRDWIRVVGQSSAASSLNLAAARDGRALPMAARRPSGSRSVW